MNKNIRGGKESLQSREQKYFDAFVTSYGASWWGNAYAGSMRRLERRLEFMKETTSQLHDPILLEVGCGAGVITQHVADKIPFRHFFACDISFKSVQFARSHCNGSHKVSFYVGNFLASQHRSDLFDVIWGNGVLHHMPVEDALYQCYRLLKPGGSIIFFEPNMLNPQVFLERHVRWIGQWLQNTEDETAFVRWSFVHQLRRVGFKNISVEPFDFLHPLVPSRWINAVDALGRTMERIPILREFSGSLYITAQKG